MCEEAEKEEEKKKLFESQFEIPKLLKERELEKKKEIIERAEIDLSEIDSLSETDLQTLQDLDKIYGLEPGEDELDGADGADASITRKH